MQLIAAASSLSWNWAQLLSLSGMSYFENFLIIFCWVSHTSKKFEVTSDLLNMCVYTAAAVYYNCNIVIIKIAVNRSFHIWGKIF